MSGCHHPLGKSLLYDAEAQYSLYRSDQSRKARFILVGEWAAVCQAIHTDDSGTRNTILSERIVQYYDQYQSEQKPEMEQLKLVV